MSHTKDEWKVFNLTDVFTDTDKLGKGDIQICDCNVHKVILETDKELSLEEAEANARLIAAAPDLLEACEEVIKNELHGITPYFDEAIRKVEAAISKAKKE